MLGRGRVTVGVGPLETELRQERVRLAEAGVQL